MGWFIVYNLGNELGMIIGITKKKIRSGEKIVSNRVIVYEEWKINLVRTFNWSKNLEGFDEVKQNQATEGIVENVVETEASNKNQKLNRNFIEHIVLWIVSMQKQ